MTDTLTPPRRTLAGSDPERAKRTAVVAWMRLARVFTKIDRATAVHLRAYDLSVAHFDVIAQVGAHEGLTQQELAEVMLVTKGNITQLLDRLERRGLVQRRPAQSGRGNHLYLTEAGWELHRAAVPSQEDLIADCFAALDPEEHRLLDRLLRKLDQSLDRPSPTQEEPRG
jgi:DNA-binding MarR family transcriptional regulator